MFADGHDTLAAVLLHRFSGGSAWHETPMVPLGNDRWAASFLVDTLGTYEYTVEGWIDRFTTWRTELGKKVAAGQTVASELLEGAELVRAAARGGDSAGAGLLREAAAAIGNTAHPEAQRVEAAIDAGLLAAMTAAADRREATRYDRVLGVRVERERARFGAWYEMFPRSAGTDPHAERDFRRSRGAPRRT